MMDFWGLGVKRAVAAAFFAVFFSATLVSQAQGPAKPATKAPAQTFTIKPKSQQPKIVLTPLEPDAVSDSTANSERSESSAPVVPTHWSRSAIGLYLNVTNNGISRSLLVRTKDTALRHHSNEFGFGIGGALDFKVPGANESVRVMGGLARLSVRPDAAAKENHELATLENSISVLNIGFLYRLALGQMLDLDTLWFGAGAQMNYIFASSHPGQGGTMASQLLGSYGYSPILALGGDIPISTYSDMLLAFHYFPAKGYALLLGVRTGL